MTELWRVVKEQKPCTFFYILYTNVLPYPNFHLSQGTGQSIFCVLHRMRPFNLDRHSWSTHSISISIFWLIYIMSINMHTICIDQDTVCQLRYTCPVRFLPNLNSALLHRACHVHPSIVSKWLKYCWKGRKTLTHPFILYGSTYRMWNDIQISNDMHGVYVDQHAISQSTYYLSQLMRLWYLSHRWPTKAQASLCIRAVLPEPSLFAHMKYGSRWRVLPKSQTSSPTGWLRMSIWRMSLWRT